MNRPLNPQHHGNVQGYRPSDINNPILSKSQLRVIGVMQVALSQEQVNTHNYQAFLNALPQYQSKEKLEELLGFAIQQNIISEALAKQLELCLLPDIIHEKFDNIQVLGQGGMGAVYKARDKNSAREVAIKTILGDAQPEEQIRFQREARAICSLSHPGLPQGHEYLETGTNSFFVQQKLQGDDFEEEIAKLYGDKTMPPDLDDKQELLEALIQIAETLDYCHNEGLAHRDLKPANMILDREQDHAKLIDFGLVKITTKGDGSANSKFTQGMSLTQEGMPMGTPQYMAPEQIIGSKLTEDGQKVNYKKMDIFALGAILNRILTNRSHLKSNQYYAMGAELQTGKYRLPQDDNDAEIPDSLNEICKKAMALDPKDRYTSAGAFAEALQEAINEIYYPPEEETPKKAKSSKWLPIGIGTGLAGGAVIGLALHFGSGAASKNNKHNKKRSPRIKKTIDIDQTSDKTTEGRKQKAKTEEKKTEPKKEPEAKKPKLMTATEQAAVKEINEKDFNAVYTRAKARMKLAINKEGKVINEDWLAETIKDSKILYAINKNQYDFLVFFSKVRLAEADFLASKFGREAEAGRAYEQAFKKFELKGFKELITTMKLSGDKKAYEYLFYEAKARLGRATINSKSRNLRQDVKNSIGRDLKDAATAISEYMGATKPSGDHLKECQEILSKINKLAIR